MTSRDDHERAIFERAMHPPYDIRQPFDAAELLDGFEGGEEVQVPVDPASPLGRAMAEARASWGEEGPPDPDAFVFPPPRPVTD